MDERSLFDRFHDALDVEPRPGAYELLRHALTNQTNQPVALRARPAFRMRFSKMGFRMAAGLTAALIAIALVATFLVVHNRPTGSVPAQTDQNVKAYRSMINAGYSGMDAATSGHCSTIQDTGCAAAVQPVDTALQRWVDDMTRFPNTPEQYRAVDAALRAHLEDAITDLNAAVAFQKANDDAGFTLAMNSAVYERAWFDPATSVILGSYPRLITTYQDTVSQSRMSVSKCLSSAPGLDELGCHRLQAHETCTTAQRLLCESDVLAEQTRIQTFLVAMVQNPAPPAQAAAYARVQADLVSADAALVAIHDALLSGDPRAADSGESVFVNAMIATEGDFTGLA